MEDTSILAGATGKERDAVLLDMAVRPVPRYTSYPTAPHFTDHVNEATYARWLREIPADTPLSLYIHVPYCAAICSYCGCNTKAVRRLEPLNAYSKALSAEIALIASQLRTRQVSRIHWGGGTPSILGPQNLISVYQELESHFELEALKEHAIELDPRVVTPLLADTLEGMDVTRVNFGVQEFSPEVQEAIGRVQPFGTVQEAVRLLRQRGISSIGFDLMYGLPQQSLNDIERTLSLALLLNPDRIAVFGYAHVPWMKKNQKLIREDELPGIDERFGQAETARRLLIAAGYEPIGIDHFALPDDELAIKARNGSLRRNFQGYTVDDSPALIGLGASAIGKLPAGYVQNMPATTEYVRTVRNGSFACARGIELSNDDRRRAAIIEKLMCNFSADLRSIDAHSFEEQFLDECMKNGLIRREGTLIEVLDKGRPYVRLVASAFDRYYQKGLVRYSTAV